MRNISLSFLTFLSFAILPSFAEAAQESAQWTFSMKPITFEAALQEFEKFEYSPELGFNKDLESGWNMSFSGLDETSSHIRQNYADNISANLGHEDTDMRFGIKFRHKLP
jgi:hypothetical protein